MFNLLEREEAEKAGRRGGLSRSERKARAARKNGRKSKSGGRKPTRTLAEKLLRRKLTHQQHHALEKELLLNSLMLVGEGRRLFDFYMCGPKYLLEGNPFETKDWRQSARVVPKDVHRIILKFRASARGLLSS